MEKEFRKGLRQTDKEKEKETVGERHDANSKNFVQTTSSQLNEQLPKQTNKKKKQHRKS